MFEPGYMQGAVLAIRALPMSSNASLTWPVC